MSDRKVRVLLVGPSLDIVGGQSVQAKRLLDALGTSDRLHAEFQAVNPRLPGPLVLLQRVKFVRTIATSIAYVIALFWRVPRFDVIHAFSASYWSYLLAPLPAMIVGRLFGKATLLNYRSGEAKDHLTTWRSAVPTIRRFVSEIVVPSGYLVEVFGRFGLHAVSIPNFVTLGLFPYRRRIALAPRFFSNRNHEAHYDVACTLRAFAIIHAAVPDASLIVAGDGPLRDELEALAHELGANVTFTGKVSQQRMAELYDECDVYLNTPRIDNMPGSIIEAFACGIPVVTTNAGGIPWIVNDGVNGLMVPMGDCEAVANAALRLLQEPASAAALADAARAECEHRYTWPAVQQEWESLYFRLAARRTGA